MPKKNKIKNQRGVSIFFAVLILSVLLAVALGINAILISQIRTLREMSDSVVSLYAADTGIERILYEDKMCRQSGCGNLAWSCLDTVGCTGGRTAGIVSGVLGNATYQASSTDGAIIISSQGIYKGIRRAIQVIRQ
jgi:hypothetical protein